MLTPYSESKVTKVSSDFVANCLETCLTAYENSEMYAKNLLLDIKDNFFMMTLEGTDWNEIYGLNALGIYLDTSKSNYLRKHQFSYLKSLYVEKIIVYADVKYLTFHNNFRTTDNMKVIINSDKYDIEDNTKLRNVSSVQYEVDMSKYANSFLQTKVTITDESHYNNLVDFGVKNIGFLNISTSLFGVPWIAKVYSLEPLLHSVNNKLEFNVYFDNNYAVKYIHRDFNSLVNELKVLTNNKKNTKIKTSLILDPNRFYLNSYNMLDFNSMELSKSINDLKYFFDEITMSGQSLEMYKSLKRNKDKQEASKSSYLFKNRIDKYTW